MVGFMRNFYWENRQKRCQFFQAFQIFFNNFNELRLLILWRCHQLPGKYRVLLCVILLICVIFKFLRPNIFSNVCFGVFSCMRLISPYSFILSTQCLAIMLSQHPLFPQRTPPPPLPPPPRSYLM